MRMTSIKSVTVQLLAGFLAGSFLLATTDAATVRASAANSPDSAASASRALAGNWHAREGMYIQRQWGVDIISVRRVSSGYMLRLSYRVVDPEKARPLFDKKVRPFVIDEVTGARLAVPAMENVGELRQTSAPVEDRTYFVIFGNPEKLVKSGAHVSIVIGDMRIDGFTVD
jgi:hypothetical protein